MFFLPSSLLIHLFHPGRGLYRWCQKRSFQRISSCTLAAGQLEENTATDVETAAVQTRMTAPVLDTKLRKSPHSVDMSDKPVAPMDMTQRRWMFVISHMDVFITGMFCLNKTPRAVITTTFNTKESYCSNRGASRNLSQLLQCVSMIQSILKRKQSSQAGQA